MNFIKQKYDIDELMLVSIGRIVGVEQRKNIFSSLVLESDRFVTAHYYHAIMTKSGELLHETTNYDPLKAEDITGKKGVGSTVIEWHVPLSRCLPKEKQKPFYTGEEVLAINTWQAFLYLEEQERLADEARPFKKIKALIKKI